MADRDDVELLSIPESERRNAAMREELLKQADIAILCLPDDASREAVAMLDGNNRTRIIDTSTAHRVASGLGLWLRRDGQAASARRSRRLAYVANPGCYPTGAISLIRPLVEAGMLPEDYPVTVNAVSGYTGGGKQMIAQMEDPSRDDTSRRRISSTACRSSTSMCRRCRRTACLSRRPIFSPSRRPLCRRA